MNIAHISAIATRVRNTIERLPASERTISMSEFPAGSCGDATLILGTYLKDQGEDGFMYISAERGTISDNTWTSHAWLAKGTLVIDITADQFIDGPAPVIVSNSSAWHSQFEIEEIYPSDLNTWSGVDELLYFYSRIKSELAR